MEILIDEVSPVAAYISGEIRINSKSLYASGMRALNAPSLGEMAYDLVKNRLMLPESLVKRVLAMMTGGPATISYRTLAMYMWYSKVNYGEDWDHKPKIRRLFRSANPARGFEWERHGNREYNYDIWSNIHYGYVGVACGFSEEILLAGAGAVQRDKTGQLRLRSGKCEVTNPQSCDDPKDTAAIRLGFSLFESNPATFMSRDLVKKVENWPGLNTRQAAAWEEPAHRNAFGTMYA